MSVEAGAAGTGSGGSLGGTPTSSGTTSAVPADVAANTSVTAADAGGATTESGTGADHDSASSVGSGKGSARATADSGRGSRLHGFLRDGDSQTIGGDQVIGDKYIFDHTGKRVVLSEVPVNLVAAVRSAFVDPPGWGSVRSRAVGSAVLILTGEAGWGKHAAAIRLLLAEPDVRLLQLDQDMDFAQLAEQVREGLADLHGGGCTGFVLDAPRRVAGLSESVLRGVEEALTKAGARLVLTIGSDVSRPDSGLSRYVINMQNAPDFERVTASHLEHAIGADRAARLLDDLAIREFITQRLKGEPACSYAERLAFELATEHRQSEDAGTEFSLARVRQRMLQHEVRSVEKWFAGLPDTKSRCLAIALAVLSGLSFELIANAAVALLMLVSPASSAHLVMSTGDDIAPEGLRPFRMARRERLQMLRAHTEPAEVQGAYGMIRSEVVEYDERGIAQRVLEHAWKGFDCQESLLRWLRELAQGNSEQIRVRAGLAIGQIACWSFDYLCAEVLESWATSDKRIRREAVAYALYRVVTTDTQLRSHVRLMVNGWYADWDEPYAQATAARVHGLALGTIDPATATTTLIRLLVVDDIWVAIDIGRGLTDLLAPDVEQAGSAHAIGQQSPVRTVLADLAAAAADRERSPAAQLAFLIVASGLVNDLRTADSQAVEWPVLLYLTQQLAEIRGPIVVLWRTVLDAALFYEEAEQVMTAWARYAEANAEVRAAFLRLARAIARGHPRCHSILRRYADLWVSNENLQPLPIMSSELRAVLAAESEAA